MSVPGLAAELEDAGKAIGLLTDSGGLNNTWFNNPGDSLGSILGNAGQRAAFLRLLDVILPPSTASDIPAGEKWHPLLGDNPLGDFYLTAHDLGSSVLFGAAGDFGTDNARLSVQLPLVSANTGVHAQPGPLRVQLRLHLGLARPADPIALDAISVVAAIAPPEISAVITLEKFSFDDKPPADMVLDPANLGSEAVQLALGLMHQVLEKLAAAAGTEAKALADHLLPLFGIGDAAIPPFPFATLASNPAAMQNWLQSLLAGPITTWLGHLAGLMGAGAVVPAGSGTDADPWVVPLVTIDPQSNLSLTVVRASGGIRIGMRALATASLGSLQAQADLALIPLNGTAHATALPSASFLFVKGPGLVSTAGIAAGTLRAGLHGTAPLSSPCSSCSMSLCLARNTTTASTSPTPTASRLPPAPQCRPLSSPLSVPARAAISPLSPRSSRPPPIQRRRTSPIPQLWSQIPPPPSHRRIAPPCSIPRTVGLPFLRNLARSSDFPARSPALARKPIPGASSSVPLELPKSNSPDGTHRPPATPPTRKNCASACASPLPAAQQNSPGSPNCSPSICPPPAPAPCRSWPRNTRLSASSPALPLRPPRASLSAPTRSSPASTGLPAPLPHGTPESTSSSSPPTAPPSPFHRSPSPPPPDSMLRTRPPRQRHSASPRLISKSSSACCSPAPR